MALFPGHKIGLYEIVSPLGKGGMGEVYRARDSKLHRDVAVKVLPASLANDADYCARFEREAQALASLNHPHIASIYGLEQNAIIMELVEGETLRGPMPVVEALEIARQIAEALEAAHDRGIIHRDLKPGNIKVTPEGIVKVLDFGLAKSTGNGSAASGADSPTLTLRATEAGLILGTAGYMSPEQATGKHVDRRADIWSFGVVLWELLTGKPMFAGETVSDTLADVLRAPIDLAQLPTHTPPAIRELLRRCLDRNLKTRLRDIGEARVAIEAYLANPVETARPAERTFPWFLAACVTACLAAAVIGGAIWFRPPAEGAPPMTFPIATGGRAFLSPDGRTLALVVGDGSRDGPPAISVRPLDSLNARQLAGTEGALLPFWSPDSKSIGFVGNGKLKRVDVDGGAVTTLADAPLDRGGSWNEKGVILFSHRLLGLQRISADGGTPETVTRIDRDAGETFHYYPQFLPGGDQFIYLVRHRESSRMGIYLASLDGRPSIRLTQTEYNAAFDEATQQLLYLQGKGTIVSRQLEFNPPRLTGETRTVASGVQVFEPNGQALFGVSRNGMLFYARAGGPPRVRFQWRSRAGNELEAIGERFEGIGAYQLSPSGRQVSFAAPAENATDIWVRDLARGQSTRISFKAGRTPRWSSDGRHIYYGSRDGISRKLADGSGEEEVVWKGDPNAEIQAISPDGEYLLFGSGDIQLLPLSGEATPRPYLQTKFIEDDAAFSPDGRWVAYRSDESGKSEVYIRGFPEHRGKWQASGNEGRSPSWRSDGKELFWLGRGSNGGSGMLSAASVELQPDSVRLGRPEDLFVPQGWVVRPVGDGRRFLVLEVPQALNPQSLWGAGSVVVLNWAAGTGR